MAEAMADSMFFFYSILVYIKNALYVYLYNIIYVYIYISSYT